jgi:hypothetical protein
MILVTLCCAIEAGFRCSTNPPQDRGSNKLIRVTRLGDFLPIGLLLKAYGDFLKELSSPKMAIFIPSKKIELLS